jgi:hypothetical protein
LAPSHPKAEPAHASGKTETKPEPPQPAPSPSEPDHGAGDDAIADFLLDIKLDDEE